MNIRSVSAYQIARQSIALTLAVLLVPFASQVAYGQGYAPLDPVALDQLVAPIALYPDSLVAQILTASTFPQQVSDADNWSRQNAALPPDERAQIVNGMPWDPSVQALTAFPTVLDNLARNYNWASSLGNAYYNQPGDVMNAIQAARYQAQQAGYLRSTPQEQVIYSNGLITIVPVNPNLVYVPYYDPWRVYGAWVSPYAGYYVLPPPRGVVLGVGIAFAAVGISVALFAHYGWGFHAWAPNWRSGVVVYNHNTYISNSTTVINRGRFGGMNRGVFERPGAGVPANFHPAVTRATANFAPGRTVNRPAPNTFNRPAPAARPNSNAARPSGSSNGRPTPPPQQNSSRNPAPAPRGQEGNRAPSYAAPAQHGGPPARSAEPSRSAPQGRPAPQGHGSEQHGHSDEKDHH